MRYWKTKIALKLLVILMLSLHLGWSIHMLREHNREHDRNMARLETLNKQLQELNREEDLLLKQAQELEERTKKLAR